MDVSLERLNYAAFKRNFTNWKFSSIPSTFTDLSNNKYQLPNKSTVHLCNDFLTNGDTENIFPDLSMKFLEHEAFAKHLSFLITPIDDTTTPFCMYKTNKIFRNTSYLMKCLKFQMELRGYKRVVNEESSVALNNILLVKDYTRFLQAKFQSSMKYYYKFEFLLRTMLNYIVNINDNRHHFIYLPVSTNTYTKSMYIKNFGFINNATLLGNKDFSFYLETQLLGFIYTQTKQLANVKPFIWDTNPIVDSSSISSTSLFSRLDDTVLNRLNLILYNGDKAVIYNLAQIKEFSNKSIFTNMVISQLFRLKGMEIADNDLVDASEQGEILVDNRFSRNQDTQTTLEKSINKQDDFENTPDASDNEDTPETVVEENNIVNDQTTQAMRLNQSNEFRTTPNSVIYKRFSDQTEDDVIELTKQSDNSVISGLPDNQINFIDDDSEDIVIEAEDDTKDLTRKYNESNSEVFPENMGVTKYNYESVELPEDKPQFGKLKELKEDINTHLSTLPNLKKTDLQRVDKLLNKQLNIKIDNTDFSSLIMTQTPELKPKETTTLKDAHISEDMKKSAILNYDEQYMEELFKPDLVKNLVCFNKNGFFVNSVTVKSSDDDFNKVDEYSIKLVDVKGKSHPIKIKLPRVDSDGNMLLNGVKSTMIKQVVNVPICKISEYRVELISNFNKTVLTRTQSVANTYTTYLNKYLNSLLENNLISVSYGIGSADTSKQLPYEYSIIKQKYVEISFDKYIFNFDYNKRFIEIHDNLKQIKMLEQKYGVFCGYTTSKEYMFWSMDDKVTIYNLDTDTSLSGRFTSILNSLYKGTTKLSSICSEYTELKIQNKVFPVGFILAFRSGLSKLIKDLNISTTFVPKGKRIKEDSSYNIKIKFNDGTLLFNRYPLTKSLVLAGLCKFDTDSVNINELDGVDVYYRLLMRKNISANYLKGITAFFDYFIDPITEEVLENMGEPTDVKNLLIRATEMVSTIDYYKSASMKHHRIRGYERLPSVVYNEIARSMASYNSNTTPNKTFSINPESVFQRVIQDSSIQMIDTINPIHTLKTKALITFGGSGGRLSRAFVTKDRLYPDDAVGIMSEASVDSGKVGMNAYLSASPCIKDLRGAVDYNTDGKEEKSSAQMLSVAGNLLPGLTQDDSKRVSFTNIQLSHHVPCENGEVSRVRTGYERVIGLDAGEDFCINAEASGKIIDVDDSIKTLKVKYNDKLALVDGKLDGSYSTSTYWLTSSENPTTIMPQTLSTKLKIGSIYNVNKQNNFSVTNITTITRDELTNPKDIKIFDALSKKFKVDKLSWVTGKFTDTVIKGETKVYSYRDKYTSAAGYTIRQPYKTIHKVGDSFEEGDTLIYNSGFFTKDPYSKNVDWKHGVMATVALIDTPENEEDGSRISEHFSKELAMDLVHTRSITLDKDSSITNVVFMGDSVQPSDKLCDLLDANTNTFVDDDNDDLEFLSDIGRNSPKAKSSGTIAEIRMYYACEPEQLNETLQKLEKRLLNIEKSINRKYEGAINKSNIKYVHRLKPKERYQTIEFTEETVLLEFIISHKANMTQGDKTCLMTSNKTVLSDCMEKPPLLEDGTKCDYLFGITSVFNRIIMSPILVGWSNIILEKTEKDICSMYFDK